MSSLRVLQAGRVAVAGILERIAQAEHSIEVRAFLWRDDDVGNRIGRALLAAADRGVKVRIHKDRIAAVYEYTGGNRQSFFHKRVSPIERLQAWLLGAVYHGPGRHRQQPSELAEAIVGHDNIEVCHEHKRFDHSKLFVFDERIITLGSMGIGDNHENEWVDVMVELEGAEHVRRLRERLSGSALFEPEREVDFLVHNRASERRRSCPMLGQRLALIDAAERTLTVEMAYMGDRRFTSALLRAIHRGVEVRLVTAALADVLGHLNRSTCDSLLKRTGAPHNFTIVLLPRMVHAKIVVVDGRITDLGSANFTPLSHGVYDEINLYADDEDFAGAVEAAIAEHCSEGEVVSGRLGYRRFRSRVERMVVAYQARASGRLPREQRDAARAEERRLMRAHRAHLRAARRLRITPRGPLRLTGERAGAAGEDIDPVRAPAESAKQRRRMRLLPRRRRARKGSKFDGTPS
ncbi:phospholipase D-like domain-containing protein [Haliangium ochraceum]|uniref:Phospholipase D/Transphosphatidylase n=1 Tax=Haliangium ochraceum (strain DSM 14365 / JCM 11303 / SMP-2) TaxID=502025 RepID=D0LLU7_HALO1|nr:phosphatidylserine/phosphatidylglycerophosphate/cardiolipin synthase family protein [Haliangium ochraceum]ACY15125.1 phospholipase D/Transphosphatidylase [Haliangium ochraceum DSM 14365]